MATNLEKTHRIYGFARSAAVEAEEQDENLDQVGDRDPELRQTLDDLRRQIESEKKIAANTRSHTTDLFSLPDTDLASHLRQLLTIKATYDRLSTEPPVLPSHGSPIHELLALRSTSQSTAETRALIPTSQSELISIRSQLASERARLNAYGLLASALQDRIQRLQGLSAERATQSPAELLEAQIESQTLQQNAYVDEGDHLLKQLSGFINDHLAPMLAAEDLGGPPVGDVGGITDEMLGMGFTSKGKAKQSKSADTEAMVDEGCRLRTAASKEIRQLVKRLLRAFDSETEKFTLVENETAATRFLIQAKIAELDPEDARCMRLRNFVGEIPVVMGG